MPVTVAPASCVGRGQHGVAVDQEDRRERDLAALLGVEQLDVDLLAFCDLGPACHRMRSLRT